MKIRQKKYKSVITQRIWKSTRKISAILCFLLLLFGYGKIQNTNSFFTDSAEISDNTFSAGYWMPILNMTISPTNPDGNEGWYRTKPCVTLTASLTDSAKTVIYYRLKNTDSYLPYPSSCVEIPDGEWDFEAYALYDDNSDWKSNLVGQNFKVNTQLIETGDVIINEVMWMGSDGKSLDQWVELKNTTDHDIHIKDWYLTYKSNAGNELTLLEIKDNRVIKKGEYLLISYYTKNNSAINVQPDDDDMNDFSYQKFQIKLYTDSTKTKFIDVAGDGAQKPKEGDGDKYYSMERNNTSGDGADYKNWHTCLDSTSTELYWDSGRLEQGTPGHDNLSENDPSHKNKEAAVDIDENNKETQIEEIIPSADSILPETEIIEDEVETPNGETEELAPLTETEIIIEEKTAVETENEEIDEPKEEDADEEKMDEKLIETKEEEIEKEDEKKDEDENEEEKAEEKSDIVSEIFNSKIKLTFLC